MSSHESVHAAPARVFPGREQASWTWVPSAQDPGGLSLSLREHLGERLCVAEPTHRAPSAQVVLVHGLTDHLGRQMRFTRWLARQGYRAVSFELAAHGGKASPWDDSAWVYEAHATSENARDARERIAQGLRARKVPARALARRQYEALEAADVADHAAQLDRVLLMTRQLDPRLPIVLVGHSMGGLLALEAAWRWSRRPNMDLRGLVLLSPALKPQARPGNRVESLLVEAVWRLRQAPFSLTRSAVKAALGLNLPVDTTWGNRWMSDLPEEVALFADDPLIPRQLPTRYASTIESQMAQTARRGARVPVPSLVLLPGIDGITSVSAGLEFARSAQRTKAGAVAATHFEEVCAHDLLRSTVGERALGRIAGWLGRLLGAPSAARPLDAAAAA